MLKKWAKEAQYGVESGRIQVFLWGSDGYVKERRGRLLAGVRRSQYMNRCAGKQERKIVHTDWRE